jgi:hypothetical protein
MVAPDRCADARGRRLTGDEDEDEAAALLEPRHRLPEHGARRPLAVGGAHGVARRRARREEVAGADGPVRRVHQHVDAADEGDGGVAVGDRAVLAHEEAGADAAGARDDAGHERVVGRGADGEAAGLRGVDRDHHARGGHPEAGEGRHVEVLGEVGAAGDLELLGDHAGAPAVVGVELEDGDVVAAELEGRGVVPLVHVDLDAHVRGGPLVELHVGVHADGVGEAGGVAARGEVLGVEAVAGGGEGAEVAAVVDPRRAGALAPDAAPGRAGSGPLHAVVRPGRRRGPAVDAAPARGLVQAVDRVVRPGRGRDLAVDAAPARGVDRAVEAVGRPA